MTFGGHTYAEVLLLTPNGTVGVHERKNMLVGNYESQPIITAINGNTFDNRLFLAAAAAAVVVKEFRYDVTRAPAGPNDSLTQVNRLGDSSFNRSITSLGDLDGSGVEDVAINGLGAVQLMFLHEHGAVGRVTEISENRSGFSEELVAGEQFGYFVTNIGDLNGDGVTDLAIGSPGNGNDDDETTGSVYIVMLNEDGSVLDSKRISNEHNGGPRLQLGEQFGSSIASIGDVNGDGVIDIAVGSPSFDPLGDGSSDGAVHVLFLDTNGSVKNSHLIDRGSSELDLSFEVFEPEHGRFGASMAALGDVNHDGITDLAVSQPGNTSGDPSAVHMLLLDPDGRLLGSHKWVIPRLWENERSTSPAAVGDLDGDSVPDLSVFRPGDDHSGSTNLISFVLLNEDGSVKRVEELETSHGRDLSAARFGDWNGDGVRDVLTGQDQWRGDSVVNLIFPLRVGDLGDAPDTGIGTGPGNYNTHWTDGGPIHVRPFPKLGVQWTTESYSLSGSLAEGDDDDGVAEPEVALTLVGGSQPSIDVFVDNSDDDVILYGWIDANFDGVFDNATERVSAPVRADANGYGDTVRLTFPTLPAGIDGRTYARFRISSDPAAADPTGKALDGEVEDYAVTIVSPETLAIKDTLDFSKPGGQIAVLGDVNGDEIDDLAVGANRIWLMTEQDTIAQEIVRDLPADLLPQAGIRSLAALGDFNGDDIPDLVLGAPAKDGPDESNTTGAIYVVLLDQFGQAIETTKIASGLNGGPLLTPNRAQDATNGFGKAITAIGDLNNDGFTDLAVSDAEENVYTLFMKQDATTGDIFVESYVVNSSPLGNLYEFGASLASLGNFNLDDDEVPDLVVGAPRYRDSFDNDWSGAVFVVLMNADGTFGEMTRISASTGMPVVKDDWFGSSISVLGDVNDDGVTDLAVSAPGSFISDRPGTVHAVYLNPEGGMLRTSVIGKGHVNGVRFGSTLANLGDLDEDGNVDLAVNRGNRPRFLYLTKETPDFSDAPESYAVASHKIDSTIYIGFFVDGEPTAFTSNLANGDDLDGGISSDENGVVAPERDLLLIPGQQPKIEVSVTNDTGRDATLYGWIDLNGNGAFETSERTFQTTDSSNSIILEWSTTVPQDFGGTTYARFRLSTDPAAADPGGVAEDGEVEDYLITVLDTDFGDAPIAYGEPSHTINQNIYLGEKVDADPGATPSDDASSDDWLGDDEDGLVNENIVLTVGKDHTVIVDGTNFTDSQATLYGWIDINGDGIFDSDTELSSTTVAANTTDSLTLHFSVPSTVSAGQTYARFRLSTDPIASDPLSAASDGEVEDYTVTIVNADFGDAPESYSTLIDGNVSPPSHKTGARLSIGATVDLETKTFFSPAANGDDLTGSSLSDEDGLVDPQVLLDLVPGLVPTVDLSVTNDTGQMAQLYGWIDLNLDGDFDLNERRVADVPDGMDASNGDFVTLTFPEIPDGGSTYARFRLSTDTGAGSPTGPAGDGEVEDYFVSISNLDYGDAPDTGEETGPGNYNTLADDDGPTHRISPNIFLGAGVDAEPDSLQFHEDGRQRLSANGDDQSGASPDDEDGLLTPSADLKIELSESLIEVDVQVANNTGGPATLYGWIDFDMDGDFEDSEHSFLTVLDGTSGPVRMIFPSLADEIGTTYARFRFTTDVNVRATGFAGDGEVEDYVVTIIDSGQDTNQPAVDSRIQESVKIAEGTPQLDPLNEVGRFGSSIAIGDLDKDGVLDMVIGATSGGLNRAGAVYLLLMNPDGMTIRESVKLDDENENLTLNITNRFGSSVAVKDLDNDGVLDLVVGADNAAEFQRHSGAVHLLFMNPDGITIRETVKLDGGADNLTQVGQSDRFGSSVTVVDLDQDDIQDLIVGASGDNSGIGAVHLLLMNPDHKTIRESVTLTTEGPLTENGKFGSSIAVGDLDQDGVLDLVVGERWSESGDLARSGAIHLLFMNDDGKTVRESERLAVDTENLSPLAPGDNFGSSVSVQDLDQDGTLDLVVGAPWDDSGGISGSGAVHLLFMNRDGKTVRDSIKIAEGTENLNPLAPGDTFGGSVAADFDQDGNLVLAVGSPRDDSQGLTDIGAVHLLYLDLQVTPETVGGAVEALPETPPEGGFQIEAEATQEDIDEWITSIETLPQFPRPNETVTITVNLDSGEYSGQEVNVPSGYQLVITSDGETVTFTGASPALTVTSGDVLVIGDVRFINSTDSPTILVQGGHLTIRDSRIEETTGGNQPAILVTGGTIDLGTTAEPGVNTIVIHGEGDLIHNATADPIFAIGNTYQIDGTELTSGFAIEHEIIHGLDDATTGVVTYIADNVYLTIDEGTHQVDLLPLVADLGSENMSFAITSAIDGSAELSADERTVSYAAFDDGLAEFSYTVTEAGVLLAERRVNFSVNNVAPIVDLGIDFTVKEGTPVSFSGVFSDAGSGDAHTFLWQVLASNGQVIPEHTAQTFTFVPVDNGTYTVTYTVTDDDGAAAIDTLSIVVENAAPVPTIDSVSEPRLEGTQIDLSASATDAAGTYDTLSYLWTVAKTAADGTVTPNFDTSSLPSWSFTPDDNGQYELSLTVSDEDGDSSTVTETISVANVSPTADDLAVELVENAAIGTELTFVTATDPGDDQISYAILGGTGQTAFAIDTNTGSISVADAALLDYETAQTHSLQIEAADEDGGSDIAEITINLLNQASISGVVFADVNEDGIYQANEPGIDSVQITLHDGVGNPIVDEHGQAITALTSDGGFYLFDDLPPGEYQLHEQQPTGVTDGAEILGSLGGNVPDNDVMQLTLQRIDAHDYAFAEIGGQVTSGESAAIGFWQNNHGQQLIAAAGPALADWLTSQFANVFGDALAGATGQQVADFYRDQLYRQRGPHSAGPAKVDAHFMATALSVYITNRNLAGDIGTAFGFTISDTGLGSRAFNVGASGAAFNVANDSTLTVMQLLRATNGLTDENGLLSGFTSIYDLNGDGIIDEFEAQMRAMANDIYSAINSP